MARPKPRPEQISPELEGAMQTVRWPRILRLCALVMALLGVAVLLGSIPVLRYLWGELPAEKALPSLLFLLSTGLWIAGTGMVLGFLSEASSHGEVWAGPFARGVANLILAGGVLAGALWWSNPASWLLLALAIGARLAARPSAAMDAPDPPT